MRKDNLENLTLKVHIQDKMDREIKPTNSLMRLRECITLQESGLEKGQALVRATSNRRLS